MNPTPTLLDLLADETQHAIVRDAESRRLTREAHIVVRPTPLRQAMGRALISLGERIGGAHREALASISKEGVIARSHEGRAAHRAA